MKMTKAAQRWTGDEFVCLDLGDICLNKRAKILMERFAAHPEASIPAACDGWSETVAAYRFLSNTDVDWRAILEPHWMRTQERMRAHFRNIEIRLDHAAHPGSPAGAPGDS